jgi:type I restriction enzyme S subunit
MMTTGWKETFLGEVLTERKETPTPESLENGEVSIVSKIGFNQGKIELRSDGKTKTGMILIHPGDLVVSGINAAKGAIAIYDEKQHKPIAATIHYGSYIPNRERVDIKYLWWFLRSAAFREIVQHHVPGGIKTELKSKRFLSVLIPLPPLDEQRRILEHVEFLSARIAKAESLRKKAGEEANALIESELNSTIQELEKKYEIKYLEELLIEANYGTSVKCHPEREKGAVPVLRIPNVASEKITLGNLKYGSLSKQEFDKTVLKQGDILVVRTNGSADLVGRCAVVPELPEPMAFASYMIRIRCNQEVISSGFLQLVLRQQRTAGFLIDFARTTAGQYNVSLGRLYKTKIPIPPLDEQRRIVAYLDSVQVRLASLRELQSKTQEELDALLPSVLDKAFSGEL